MASPDPKRGHHVINNDVNKIYRDIIKAFVDTLGAEYFHGCKILNLTVKNIINEVGLPADCVLGTAPLPLETMKKIEQSTVHFSRRGTDENAESFGKNKSVLLHNATMLMHEILLSLQQNEMQMPAAPNEKLAKLRESINSFNRDVFVDKTALKEWKKKHKKKNDESFKEEIEQVEEMIWEIAGEGSKQLVLHWGQWAFRVSEGFRWGYFEPN